MAGWESFEPLINLFGQVVSILVGLAAIARLWIRPLEAGLSELKSELKEELREFRKELVAMREFSARLDERVRAVEQRVYAPVPALPLSLATAEMDRLGVLRAFAEALKPYLGEIEPTGNPVSEEEIRWLHAFRERVASGQLPSSEDLARYDYIVRKLQAERPNDPAVWMLITFGAFLLGLTLGSKSGTTSQ